MTLDLYCERLGPGLLAEPMNALSNGAFLLAACWIRASARRLMGGMGRQLGTLVVLVVAIGVGSTLFHTLATPWALLADVIPILLFQLTFLWIYLRQRAKLPPGPALGLTAGFLIATLASRGAGEVLNGSLAYGPTLLVLLAIGWHDRRRRGSPWLLMAAGTFGLSLVLRTIDQWVCPWQPVGTHLFWHLLNAVVLALAARSLMPGRPAPRARHGHG
ncbi:MULTISPECIES: ceramidase domain-containing protein [Aphanothece]|uniref:ceramidase domain-containing protein n=1 Tax=Aphanothece TaxID=1121 RepID=UPI00398468A4